MACKPKTAKKPARRAQAEACWPHELGDLGSFFGTVRISCFFEVPGFSEVVDRLLISGFFETAGPLEAHLGKTGSSFLSSAHSMTLKFELLGGTAARTCSTVL